MVKGRIAGHGKPTLIQSPHLPRVSSKRNDREIERRHRFFTSSKTDLRSSTGLLKIVQSYPVSDIFNPNRHLPHPPTSERCSDVVGFSEKFGNCRPPLSFLVFIHTFFLILFFSFSFYLFIFSLLRLFPVGFHRVDNAVC